MTTRACANDQRLSVFRPLVTLVRSYTVAKVDSIGLVVRRWIQCSAGYLQNSERRCTRPSGLGSCALMTAAVSRCSGCRRAGSYRLFTANDQEAAGITRFRSGVANTQSSCRTTIVRD